MLCATLNVTSDLHVRSGALTITHIRETDLRTLRSGFVDRFAR